MLFPFLRLATLLAVAQMALYGQAISFLAPVYTVVNPGPGAGSSQPYMTVGDLNGDGKLDVVLTESGIVAELAPTFAFFGNGDGTFRRGALLDGTNPLLADFNGDGRMDVFIGGAVYLSNADGTFQPKIAVSQCDTGASVAADLNGDGKADLICRLSVFLGNGDGTFRMGPPPNIASTTFVELAADFNRDGKPDLLLETCLSTPCNMTGGAVALGNGDGTFGAQLPISIPGFAVVYSSPADLNGDGKIDLLGACGANQALCVAFGNGDGTFGPSVANTGVVAGSYYAAADFNGDGKMDLIIGGGVVPGHGDGTFGPPVFFNHNVLALPGDFNGDGRVDIVEAESPFFNSGEQMGVLLNDSPGDGFVTAGVSSATFTLPVGSHSIASAFGANLAPQTASASPDSPPTTLGGIRIHVMDSTGDTLAPLIYVSATQINYVMTSSDPSFAAISIERVGSPFVPKGIGVAIDNSFAPGFYTVGAGLAAATALSVAQDSTQTPVAVISCATVGCTLVPIDLSGNPVYLSLYGTGFDNATASGVTCTVAGQNAAVTYASPQMQEPGLDQLNMLLPKSAAGAGLATVACAFPFAHTANPVQISIR